MAESRPKKVKYVGLSDERVIRKSDWDKAGVKSTDTTRWNRKNKFTVDGLSEGALTLLKKDKDFVITNG